MSLCVVPITLEEANQFVYSLHRHKPEKLPGHSFSVGVALADKLVGVAIVGNPSAPALQDGILAEIRRVCTDGTPNACSMLHGTARKAARAMGRRPVITYTLATESGASLRAAGFRIDKQDAGGPAHLWHNRPGRKVLPTESDLIGGKVRWIDEPAAPAAPGGAQ
jgi:hypothetical protein